MIDLKDDMGGCLSWDDHWSQVEMVQLSKHDEKYIVRINTSIGNAVMEFTEYTRAKAVYDQVRSEMTEEVPEL